MAAYRQPGVLSGLTNAAPRESGTLVRAATSTPTPVGVASKQKLSDNDLELIRSTAGRNIDGSSKPLPDLLYLRGIHLQRKAAGIRDYGPQSWAALFEQATVDQLSELIEVAQSPYGKAAAQLQALVEEMRRPGSAVTDKNLSDAIGTVLGEERRRQLLGSAAGDSGGSEAMALVVEAMSLSAERKNAALKQLLDRAELPGSPVSDEQITTAVQEVLGHERQRQLLGGSEAEGGSGAMELVLRASEVFADRKNTALKKLIEKAKVGGSAVTDEQLRKGVQEVLGVERQRELLGGKNTGAESMGLVVEAAKVFMDRKAAALAKLYDSDASEAQIKQATTDYEGAKNQLRQMGVAIPEGGVKTGSLKIDSRPPKNQ